MLITKTNQVENHHVFALIVGSSGIGKTSLAKTLPHNETLILSAESGLLSIKDAEIDVLEISTFAHLAEAFKFITTQQNNYKHIFVDSLTEIGEILFNELKPNYDKKNTFGLYEEYGNKLVKFLKALRDLTQYNIWLTCLDKMADKDFTQVLSIDLHQKSLAKSIPKLFDEVFHMTSIERDGEPVRCLITDNTMVDFAKDRSGKLDRIEKPDLLNVYNKIFN